eukprot:jgi/Botrbrau1/3333/Bobra.0048s0028.1
MNVPHYHGRSGISEGDAHQLRAIASQFEGTLFEGAMTWRLSNILPCPSMPSTVSPEGLTAQLLHTFPGDVSWIAREGIHSYRQSSPCLQGSSSLHCWRCNGVPDKVSGHSVSRHPHKLIHGLKILYGIPVELLAPHQVRVLARRSRLCRMDDKHRASISYSWSSLCSQGTSSSQRNSNSYYNHVFGVFQALLPPSPSHPPATHQPSPTWGTHELPSPLMPNCDSRHLHVPPKAGAEAGPFRQQYLSGLLCLALHGAIE